ncbi:MAG TPA: hypothetical protein VGG97_08630 [Bryobacteraceae bacterium]
MLRVRIHSGDIGMVHPWPPDWSATVLANVDLNSWAERMLNPMAVVSNA